MENQKEMWIDGYIMGTEYTENFYYTLTPAMISYCTMIRGFAPQNCTDSFNYFELGCGNGMSTNILAASNPQGNFFANDFNQKHIENANKTAKNGGLGNVQFFEKSFEDMLAVKLPKMDYICLHGIYSWVSDESRTYIRKFIEKNLKPDGTVYISYNCKAGWSYFMPLRDIMLRVFEEAEGDVAKKISASFGYIEKMIEKKPKFFEEHPYAKKMMKFLKTKNVNYIAHELFNRNWTLFNHSDVARDMQEMGLAMVGGGNAVDNIKVFNVPENMMDIFNRIHDPVFAEDFKDLIMNKQFRVDIFRKNAKAPTKQEIIELFFNHRVVMNKPAADCEMKAKIPVGNLGLKEEIYRPIINELDAGAQKISDLYGKLKSKLNNCDAETFINYINKLVAVGYIFPAVPENVRDNAVESCRKFNESVINSTLDGHKAEFMASPVLGAGMKFGFIEQMMIHAYKSKAKNPPEFIWNIMKKKNLKIQSGGKRIESDADNLKHLQETQKRFQEKSLRLYQNLGVV